jgi:lysophospholipid hydrolase
MTRAKSQSDSFDRIAWLATTALFGALDEATLHNLGPELEWIQIAGGESLVHHGDVGDCLYLVTKGRLRVVVDNSAAAEQVLSEVGPGESVGEMALLIGQPWLATVSAVEDSEVMKFSRTSFERLAQTAPATVTQLQRAITEHLRRVQLRSILGATKLFGALDAAVLRDLEAELEWMTLISGETLIHQGDPGDCLYMVISGRLRVVLERDGQVLRVFREVGRGESIGEMALVTGEPRTATVYAIRDTEVVKLPQAGFDRLLATYPHAMTKTFTRSIIQNLNRQLAGERPGVNTLIAVAIVPASKDVQLSEFTQRFVAALAAIGPTLHLSSERVDHYLGKSGIAQDDIASWQTTDVQLAGWLSEQETKYPQIVYETDLSMTPWTQRCIRQADQILIVGQATGEPALGEIETELLGMTDDRSSKRKSLVLLHRERAQRPVGTHRWLTVRQVEQHYHVRWNTAADFARLARFVAGRAIGLALGGGGARGFAHIGVIRALEEAGIPIDATGGTSAGSMMAAQCALGYDAQTILAANRDFVKTDLNDYTFPLVSLMTGRKMAEKFQAMFADIHIEDMWLPYFCVSTNLTQAEPMIHRTGLLWRGLRASNGLPGLLPPLILNGEALVDGGLLNNLPMDIMRSLCGQGTVIAVDVAPPVDLAKITQYGDALSGWQALQDRLNPFTPKLNIPNLISLLYRTAEIGSVHDQKTLIKQGIADLYIRPPVEVFSMVDHKEIDKIAEVGYHFAKEKLAEWQHRTL